MKNYDLLILGGGAAGFFAAINCAEHNPHLKIAILERGKEVLGKVRVSGGGRCNVTHNCFEAAQLVRNYPRGEKELRGPFHVFGPAETVAWFEKRGVKIKTEPDGRMFPESDSSQTIIDCFLSETKRLGISVLTSQSVSSIYRAGDYWKVETQSEQFGCEKLVMATGSNPKIWDLLEKMGHSVVPAVASLFTFNIKDPRIIDLPGVAKPARVKILNSKLESHGPLLITHWGMSGPAILKLSAWGARFLADVGYKFRISVNWLEELEGGEVLDLLKELKQLHAKKTVFGKAPFEFAFPNRLWESLVTAAGISKEIKWADLTKVQLLALNQQLSSCEFEVNGKSTFKEEFVTAGGVDLREVNFKTMESKIHKDMYFAGEILNIDAITGGFNFQNAWTDAFILSNTLF